MKLTKWLTAIVMLIAVSVMYGQDQAEMMRKWQESINPGPMHQMLAKMVGNWKTVMIMPNPMTGEEIKSEGSMTVEALLGGRYFKSTQSGNMMGMPFEGVGMDGYDNVAKEFVTIWMDNMGTGIMMMKGSFNETEKTFVYKGESLDPMSGKFVKYRSVTKALDDDHINFDMYTSQGGEETKAFTMKYERVK
jgi:hypothetical protein